MKPKACTSSCEKGFSLMEVLVTLVIITLVSSGIFQSLLLNIRQTRDTFYRSQAVLAAQEYLDQLRMLDPHTIPQSGQVNTSVDIADREFDIEVTHCATQEFCTPNTRHIELDVFYRGKKRFHVETVYTKLK
jgi:prepilin-type N-terminal cleavage/methylation domain-containing protein